MSKGKIYPKVVFFEYVCIAYESMYAYRSTCIYMYIYTKTYIMYNIYYYDIYNI